MKIPLKKLATKLGKFLIEVGKHELEKEVEKKVSEQSPPR